MRKNLLALTVCILSLFIVCNTASAQKQRTQKPTLTFDVTLPTGKAAGGQTELRVFINERLVNTFVFKAEEGCVTEDIIASLPHELSQLKDVDLLSLVAEKAVAFDNLPWDKLRESFDSFEIYANGKRVHQVEFSERLVEDSPADPAPEPGPDCTANVGTPSISCTPWSAPTTTSNSFNNPCLLGMNCDTPIWGTQVCTVTVTTKTRTCTTSTTTTWTPHTPGVTCPPPLTITSSSVQTDTLTSPPSCGPCH